MFNKNKGFQILAGALFSAIIVQGIIWADLKYLDTGIWTEGAEIFSTGSLPPTSHPINGYPGTLLLLPSSFLIRLDIGALLATKIVMVVLLSLGIACCVSLCYHLRKKYL